MSFINLAVDIYQDNMAISYPRLFQIPLNFTFRKTHLTIYKYFRCLLQNRTPPKGFTLDFSLPVSDDELESEYKTTQLTISNNSQLYQLYNYTSNKSQTFSLELFRYTEQIFSSFTTLSTPSQFDLRLCLIFSPLLPPKYLQLNYSSPSPFTSHHKSSSRHTIYDCLNLFITKEKLDRENQ